MINIYVLHAYEKRSLVDRFSVHEMISQVPSIEASFCFFFICITHQRESLFFFLL